MNYFNQVPLLRLLIPFLFGIISYVFTSVGNFPYLIFLFSAVFFCSSVILSFVKVNNIKFAPITGISYYLLFYFAGVLITQLNYQANDLKHFSHFDLKQPILLVQNTQAIQEKDKTVRSVFKVIAVRENEKWIPCNGRIMMSLEKDSMALQIGYGDQLIVDATISSIPDPGNPSEFNYKRYLSFQNVFNKAYVNREGWKVYKRDQGNSIVSLSINIRDHLLQSFARNGIAGKEFAVGAALVLGYEDRLDQETMMAYASTGALHVLSVSGLHIGIIYLFFSYCLFFMDKIRNGRWYKAFILIGFLWFYALLTGFSPSVLRAVTMFSFIIIGKALEHRPNIYNTLAVSAFLLLVYNPFMLMEVGFQLSFIAVLGIVMIQPPLEKLFDPGNRLVKSIWQIAAVSIAAQLATFPLGLLYFHQFPNYFLLSNLVVIPVSNAILFLGIGMCLFYKVPFIIDLLATLFKWTIWFLNWSVSFMEKLPYAIFNNISISVVETWLIYSVVGFACLFLLKKQYKMFMATLTGVFLLLVVSLSSYYSQSNQQSIHIYNVRNQTAVNIVLGKTCFLFGDSALLNNPSKMLFHIRHHLDDLGISQRNINLWTHDTTAGNFYKKRNIIAVSGKNIVIAGLDSVLNYVRKPEIILITRNFYKNGEQVLRQMQPKRVVLDNSNTPRTARYWKNLCNNLKIDIYMVSEQKAFSANI